jgi:hypothetical protein
MSVENGGTIAALLNQETSNNPIPPRLVKMAFLFIFGCDGRTPFIKD